MMEYDRTSEQLLIAFSRSFSVLLTRQELVANAPASYRRLDCEDDIGGVGFLGSESGRSARCVITLRNARKM